MFQKFDLFISTLYSYIWLFLGLMLLGFLVRVHELAGPFIYGGEKLMRSFGHKGVTMENKFGVVFKK